VHLVNQVNLVATTGRCVLHVIQQLAGILHLGTGGRIHFNQDNKAAFLDLGTGRALATGLGGDTLFTVETAGQNTGNGGFADTTGTGEQVGMVQAFVIEGIDQGFEHVPLSGHFLE